jgi:hypothetical protein
LGWHYKENPLHPPAASVGSFYFYPSLEQAFHDKRGLQFASLTVIRLWGGITKKNPCIRLRRLSGLGLQFASLTVIRLWGGITKKNPCRRLRRLAGLFIFIPRMSKLSSG